MVNKLNGFIFFQIFASSKKTFEKMKHSYLARATFWRMPETKPSSGHLGNKLSAHESALLWLLSSCKGRK